MATRLLAIGMDIADIQKFLGHADISATRICIYAETSIAMLQQKFDCVTSPAGRDLMGTVRDRHGEFSADLLAVSGTSAHMSRFAILGEVSCVKRYRKSITA